jgi:L-ascorbate metabolism protein UlaG (beta-lactamase superfamily)
MVTYEGVTFDRLGHASVRIETGNGPTVYVDPWADVLDGEPNDGDVVFSTHDDLDHYDPDAIDAVAGPDATTVFFPSDTDFLPHHETASADVLLPPIGGHYTMDRHEAAALARAVDPDLVLPVHYDTFDAVQTDAEAFAGELAADGIRVELF